MAFLRLFRPPTHQQFSYKPRYWDPKKEEAEERRRRVEAIQEGGVEGMKERLRGGFRKGTGGYVATGTYRSQRVRRSNVSLVIIMVVLVALTVLGLMVYFPDMEAWLG